MEESLPETALDLSEVGSALHPLVKLAKSSVETWVSQHRVTSPPGEPAPEMAVRAGVFVCLKDRSGMLRGCIGTFEPTQPSVAEETIQNAIASATRDPRFPPVAAAELPSLRYTVDVLSAPERIQSEKELDPLIYGVIVERDFRRGLLLPDLEGVDTAAAQVSIAKRKAGIGTHEPVQLYRFRVERYK